MVTQIIAKIRAVLQDAEQSGVETYEASGDTFVIAQENASEITSVSVDGSAISSGDYSYDVSSQTVEIESGHVATGDVVIISYKYTKYSDDELTNFIKTALIYLSDYLYTPSAAITDEIFDVESGDEDIAPIPTAKEQNLISTIVGILINPDWTQYRTSSIQVIYDHSNKLSREQKIEKLIARFKRDGAGIAGVVYLYDIEIAEE
jgi:hypothetical protein